MNLEWGDSRKGKFATNVGLITSKGKKGDNIMACEWTHGISYAPGIISVCIAPGKQTAMNIAETKVFGVNLAAEDQNVLASIAGGNTGRTVDKIKILEELGFKFSKAKKINTLMVEGAAFQAECKLIKKIPLGDHIMFVGEIVEIYPLSEKQPLVYAGHKYFKIGKQIMKPGKRTLDNIKRVVEKHTRV